MANFKTHTTLGIIVGFFFSAVCLLFSTITNIWIAFLIVFGCFVGSFLPVIDSNSGKPIKIFSVFFSFLFAIIGLYFFYKENYKIEILISAPIIIFLIIWFPGTYLVKKLTKHRGIFHSIPMSFLSFLMLLFFLDFFKIPLKDKFIISLSIMIGYLSHLILDEIYSLKLSKKKLLEKKKSFGTALKFYSKHKKTSIFVYILILIFLFLNKNFFEKMDIFL